MMHPDNRPAWRTARKAAIGLVIGLAVGPLLANAIGLQVTSDHRDQQVQAAIDAEQIEMCLSLARQDAAKSGALDFDQRFALAQRYATFPWDKTVSNEVLNRCANGLSQ